MTNSSVTLSTKSKILRLRNLLNQVSNASYSFSKINKDFPVESITEEEGIVMVKLYEDLLRDTIATLQIYKEESE